MALSVAMLSISRSPEFPEKRIHDEISSFAFAGGDIDGFCG